MGGLNSIQVEACQVPLYSSNVTKFAGWHMEADCKIYFSTGGMYVKPLVFESSHFQFGT